MLSKRTTRKRFLLFSFSASQSIFDKHSPEVHFAAPVYPPPRGDITANDYVQFRCGEKDARCKASRFVAASRRTPPPVRSPARCAENERRPWETHLPRSLSLFLSLSLYSPLSPFLFPQESEGVILAISHAVTFEEAD